MGAVVGAGLALLFAPMAGSETRRRIGQTADNLRNGATDQMDQVKNAIKDGAGDVGAAIDAGKDAYRRRAEASSQGASSST